MEDRSRLASGTAIAIAPGVRRLVAGNPGLMTGPGTNTYLLGSREIAVLDPGPPDDAHLQRIIEVSGAPIRWVIATHTHGDHSPLAKRLAQTTGAELIGVPPPHDGRQDMTFAPDRVPEDGAVLQLGDIVLSAIRTPGHASNCVCYLKEDAGMLFSGDHVLEGVSPVILPPDGNMADYLSSIEKLMSMNFDRIAPGHGGVIDNGKQTLALLRKHRMMRESKVISALRAVDSATLESLTPRVYDDVPADRHKWAQLTLEAHLIKLQNEKRVDRDGALWSLRPA